MDTCLQTINSSVCPEEEKLTLNTLGEPKFLAMLFYWVARSPSTCENGIMNLKIQQTYNGTRSSFRYHFSQEACSNRYIIYPLTLNKKTVSLVVFDSETRMGDIIVLHKFWNSHRELTQFLSWIKGALMQIHQTELHLFETYFPTETFLRGTFYFYLKALRTCGLDRDPLLTFLNSDLAPLQAWVCYVSNSLKEVKIQVPRIIRQPKVKPEFVGAGRAEDVGLECSGLTTLLNSSCGQDLSDTMYSVCQVYQEQFVDHFIQTLPNACYAGKINIAANLQLAWSKVYSKEKMALKCRAVPLMVVLIHLSMGNFKPSTINQDIAKQAKILYRQGESKNHAMVLIVDNEKKEVELFEPNGAAIEWVPLVFDAAKSHFTDFASYKWLEPQEFCPRVSIQGISKHAMCAYFSMLWVYLRTHCPLIDRETLVRVLLQGGPHFIDRLLIGLQCLIIQFVQTSNLPPTYVRLPGGKTSRVSCGL